jgi:hypothetical protein
VVAAGTGVLCQLEAEGPFRGEALRWVPGFADDDPTDNTDDPDGADFTDGVDSEPGEEIAS